MNYRSYLADLESRDLKRSLRYVRHISPVEIEVDGRRLVNFASNDYLGLSFDQRIAEAAFEEAKKSGVGAGASRLISGSDVIHREFEERFADWKGFEAALMFPSGWMANTGLLQTVFREGDVVYSDRLNHASIIDGLRLSRATVRIYDHRGEGDCRGALRSPCALGNVRGPMLTGIVSETLFSMDGDVPDLVALASFAAERGAELVLDDAHATGVLGPDGRGLSSVGGIREHVAFSVSTLGKAFGVSGGIVCASRERIEFLVNTCRSFIYSTAMPTFAVAACLKALEIVQAEPERRERVLVIARRVREALGLAGESPIIPVILGSEAAALAKAKQLDSAGIFVPAIRPPTVPAGESRLRVTVSAAHSDEQVERLLEALTSS
ncbi:MAG: 8-amino-7-oxononanoate synthase [Planctomycetes bacterium]|nr:8-amino-7-oxononanoate synthase [Planctomycetota bacterium]